MASTPVSAVAPEENACRSANSVMGASDFARFGSGVTASAFGHPETAHSPIPTTSMTRIEAMKAYVGNANSAPDSRTPRRLATVSSTMQRIDSSTVYGASEGANDTIATIPDTTGTATVIT